MSILENNSFELRNFDTCIFSNHRPASHMDVDFDDDDLDRLETDATFSAGFGSDIVRGFRKVMQRVRAAHDERDLYAIRGLRFEKLDGVRSHQHSLRINDQWRVIVELRGKGSQKRVGIVGIKDYH